MRYRRVSSFLSQLVLDFISVFEVVFHLYLGAFPGVHLADTPSSRTESSQWKQNVQ